MTSTIFFSNSRSLERPGLIIETLEYYCHCLYFGYLLSEVEGFYCVQLQHNGLEDLEAGIFNYFLFWFMKKVKVVLKSNSKTEFIFGLDLTFKNQRFIDYEA